MTRSTSSSLKRRIQTVLVLQVLVLVQPRPAMNLKSDLTCKRSSWLSKPEQSKDRNPFALPGSIYNSKRNSSHKFISESMHLIQAGAQHWICKKQVVMRWKYNPRLVSMNKAEGKSSELFSRVGALNAVSSTSDLRNICASPRAPVITDERSRRRLAGALCEI